MPSKLVRVGKTWEVRRWFPVALLVAARLWLGISGSRGVAGVLPILHDPHRNIHMRLYLVGEFGSISLDLRWPVV